MKTLGNLGEHEVIRRLTAMLGSHAGLKVGAGDDCAVCNIPGGDMDQVFTTDPVVEGVHFLGSETPERVGNKAAGRVLSDIAAMGASPQWLLVNVVAPASFPIEYLERIYEGMNALCRRFNAVIIGGDLARGPVLELHVFGTGIVPAGRALLRSGAQPGDRILVTGPLGGSGAGKHLDFVPRVLEGVFLRESGLVTSMMDVSDGLATDLRHVLHASGTGAILEAGSIPCAASASVEQALFDGEDFELLFTVPDGHVGALKEIWSGKFGTPLHVVGVMDNDVEVLRVRDPGGAVRVLKDKAFEHFSPGQSAS